MIYAVEPGQSALLVIDPQEEYFDPTGQAYFPESSERLGNINSLIEAFAAAPVVYIRHAHRPTGVDVGRMGDFAAEDEEDSFLEGTAGVAFHRGLLMGESPTVITKTRYDSFWGTDLEAVLRTLGTTTVVIAGYMTSFCCDTTARAAQTRDYETVFVADAMGGPEQVRLDAPHIRAPRCSTTWPRRWRQALPRWWLPRRS